MTNKTAVTRKRHPGFGVLLGGLDRLSSAGGKAVLDQQLIQPNGPLQVQHATFLESTIGGLLLLLRIYLPIPARWRRGRGAGAPEGAAERPAGSRRLALLTFVTIAGDKALLVLALTSIPFGIAGGIYYAIPLIVPVVWGIRSGHRGRAAVLTLFAAALAVGVVLLVQQDGTAQGDHFLLGVLCAVGAGAAKTLFLPVTDRLIQGAGRVYTEKAIAWSLVIVGVLAGAVAWATGGFAPLMNWPIIIWAVVVGLLNNTLPRIIQMPARELAGDAVYAVFLAASPVIATLVGVAFLGDRLDVVQWAGLVVMTVSATAVANMSLNLKGKGHAPLIELSSATPEAVLEHALKERGEVLEQLERLTQEFADCEQAVARAELNVAEARLAKASADAGKAKDAADKARAGAKRARTEAENATAKEEAANAAVGSAREGVRLAQEKQKAPTTTS
ncbi:EamA family transporter [Spirillospora sp. CA-128828]|uniref:EamA family transporter n=1 Tax=Spirillospora sp. CA-128828 TaxID=3240033 RepID=UPI003D922588